MILFTEYTCTELPSPANGTISYDAGSPGARPANLTTALYNCDPGYNLLGNNTRSCQVNETWSGDTPTCESKEIEYYRHFLTLLYS